MDEIFIDTIILFIDKHAKKQASNNQANIDDNYNISLFLNEILGLSTQFVSNWQYNINGLNVVIGVDLFSIDYLAHGYLHEIVESLQDFRVSYGLDVSNVGGFDELVF